MIPLMRYAFFNETETRKELAEFILSDSFLSMGKECAKFEKSFAEFQGRKYAVLVNSGASANLLMLQTLKNMGKLHEGDNIGFSALTWSTNVSPIIILGMNPVPIDVSKENLNVMAEDVELAIIEEELDAFFATNVLGFCGDLDKIKEVCDKYGVLFIEDSCESLGSELNGVKTGNFGLMSSFSYYIAHHLSCVEGGMVCTDDEDIYDMLVMGKANGWSRTLPKDKQDKLREQYGIESEFHEKYTFYTLGQNFRPTELTGFLGNTQMKYLKENLQVRHNNYLEVEYVIKNNPDLHFLDRGNMNFLPAFAIPVIAKSVELRDKYFDKLSPHIELRPVIAGNITRRQPMWDIHVNESYYLPNTDFLDSCGFYFTNDPSLTRDEIELIKELLRG